MLFRNLALGVLAALMMLSPSVSAQEGPAIDAPGGTESADGAAIGEEEEAREGENATENTTLGPQQGGGDAQNVGGYQARPGSGLWGLLLILGLLLIGFLIYRRRGGRLDR